MDGTLSIILMGSDEAIALQEGTEGTFNGVPLSAIRLELDRIMESRVFSHSHRIRRFLQFIVEEALLGQQQRLKEYLIGLEVFGRKEEFDPRVDSIVRVEARRLRSKIDEYYRTEGRENDVRVELRKGSYVPVFEFRRLGQSSSIGRSQQRVVRHAAPQKIRKPRRQLVLVQ